MGTHQSRPPSTSEQLFHRVLGDEPQTGQRTTVVICHGLLGQGRNWTAIAQALVAAGCRAILPDLPNHGRSPWTENFDYDQMADAVCELLDGQPAAWVGHSMGAKVAMCAALRRRELVARLAVIDMSPVSYSPTSSSATGATARYLQAMAAVDLTNLDPATGRADADRQLAEVAPDRSVRGFLLQNLRRVDEQWQWQPNVLMLRDQLQRVADWPPVEASIEASYEGPTLWLAGAQSDYIRPEHHDAMHACFPKTRSITIKHAGHWVHADQPDVTASVLRQFVTNSRPPVSGKS